MTSLLLDLHTHKHIHTGCDVSDSTHRFPAWQRYQGRQWVLAGKTRLLTLPHWPRQRQHPTCRHLDRCYHRCCNTCGYTKYRERERRCKRLKQEVLPNLATEGTGGSTHPPPDTARPVLPLIKHNIYTPATSRTLQCLAPGAARMTLSCRPASPAALAGSGGGVLLSRFICCGCWWWLIAPAS